MNPPVSYDPTVLARMGKLSVIARTVVEGFLFGLHQSPYKGYSIEFAEHRQYYPGDEIRHIDWRAFGKTDRYFIKEYEEETNLKAYLLVDASGSMGYRGKGISKFQYATFAAASLAYLMTNQLDAVGLMVHDQHIRQQIPPKAHHKHLQHLLLELEKIQPGGETRLAPLWHELAEKCPHRGMIIILSDCFDELEGLSQAMRHFRFQGHEVLVLQILAPEEMEFPFGQWTQFRNLELSSDRILLDARRVREDYLANFHQFCQKLADRCSKMQVDYFPLRTDAPLHQALGYFLSRRSRKK